MCVRGPVEEKNSQGCQQFLYTCIDKAFLSYGSVFILIFSEMAMLGFCQKYQSLLRFAKKNAGYRGPFIIEKQLLIKLGTILSILRPIDMN